MRIEEKLTRPAAHRFGSTQCGFVYPMAANDLCAGEAGYMTAVAEDVGLWNAVPTSDGARRHVFQAAPAGCIIIS
jgi:hypothetical protein